MKDLEKHKSIMKKIKRDFDNILYVFKSTISEFFFFDKFPN